LPFCERHRLPRALYFNAELGQEIPAKLYTAAAEVLAYVYQLKSYQTEGGIAPTEPVELPVPADMDPENKNKGNQLETGL
jgi:flagellar biosynthetic protein FlhB